MATMAAQFDEPGVGEQTFVRPAEPHATKTLARLYFATFWMIIFTGCIRKWLFPSIGVFYLLQDIPITLGYIYAFYRGYMTRGMLLVGILLLSAVMVFLGVTQVLVIGLSPVVAFIGLHHYLYYLPMMVAFPLALTPKYRRNFIRCNLWACIPMLPLSVAQALSPVDAFINQSSNGDAFGVSGSDVARVTGPFNFTASYGIWVATALSLCLGEWLLPRSRRASRSTLLLSFATFSWALIALISASRENIVLCAAGATGAVFAVFLIRSTRGALMIALGLASLPIVAGLVYTINPDEFLIIVERFTDSKHDSSYDMKGRIGENIYGWLTEPDYTLLGKGVGMGIDAAHFGSVDPYGFTYGLKESDTVRNVIELGTPVGYLWCIVRFSFAIGMILFAWRLVYISPHCMALAYMLFAQVVWELTRNATTTMTQVMMGYCFIFGVYHYPEVMENRLPAPELPVEEDTALATA